MGSFNEYLELKILDHLLGGDAYAPLATVYLALFTAAPGESGGGTEVSAGGYARVASVNDAMNWPAAAAGAKSNGTAITFPAASADWGTVTDFAIFDASSGGNMLLYGTLDTPRSVPNGATASFGIGTLTLTLT